jgi:hypothetical protein
VRIWLFIFSIFTFFTIEFALGQENVAFSQLDEVIVSIRLNRGDILFSEKFEKYLEGYNRLKAVEKQRDLNETEKSDLIRLNQLLQELNNKSESLKPYMGSILEARDKALFHGADDFAPSLFVNAENNLHKLTDKFSENAQAQSNEDIDKAIRLYREAEFEAVRNKLLSEVRILITEAKDLKAEKYTPNTYKRVNDLLEEVENILATGNYDDPNLGQKAADLLEESKHLLYLVQLARQVNRQDAAFEEYLLSIENGVEEIITILSISSPSSEGIEKTWKMSDSL